MALTSPWRFSNYMGQFASDGAADSGIAGYGISVSDGQMYYNTTLYKMRLRANGAWTDMGSAPTDDWMESVLDRLATPPGSPSTGDRYLIIATATGAWSGKENQIAGWDGSAWAYTIPTVGKDDGRGRERPVLLQPDVVGEVADHFRPQRHEQQAGWNRWGVLPPDERASLGVDGWIGRVLDPPS